jgi:hypothetical protein
MSGTCRFLLPDDLDLPPGDFPLHTSAGRQRRVDVAVLAPFEVSAEEAETWAKAQLQDITRRLEAGLKEALLGRKRADADAGMGATSGPAKDQERPNATPGLDLLAAITGTPRADLETGGGAVVEALRRYASDLGGTVAGAVSGDAARIATAQARMAEWAATLREHGTEFAAQGPAAGPPPAAGEAPPAKRPPPEQTSTAEGASGIAARLHALADDFRRRADALAAAHGTGDPTDASTAGRPSVAHDGGTGPPIAPTSAETQAAALEALAAGLEDAAGDAAARLRAQAARLRGGS